MNEQDGMRVTRIHNYSRLLKELSAMRESRDRYATISYILFLVLVVSMGVRIPSCW
jgi:hypothetical protein